MRGAGSAASERVPTLPDIRRAHRVVLRHLPATPMFSYPTLNRVLGFEAFVKHENHQPVGAFKIRGGVNLVHRLSKAERSRGLVGASTGNHGQSIAYAARLFGAKATIVVPRGANPAKIASIRALGARIVEHGDSFDAARGQAEAIAARDGSRYVHSGNEPRLIEGVATIALEMLEQEPDLDAILVPVGGGSGAAGACLARTGLKSKAKIVAVQSAQAPSAFQAWRTGRFRKIPSRTFAEGLATAVPFELPQRILREHLDDFVLVDDDEIRAAMRTYLEAARTLAEAAGASPLAAATRLRARFRSKKVGLVLSGGNITTEQLRAVLG